MSLRALFRAAGALGRHDDAQPLARDDPTMNDGWCIVPRVPPLSDGAIHHRFTQEAFLVASCHPLNHRVFQPPSRHPHILADLQEDHHHPTVLAQWHALQPCDLGVFQEPFQDLPSKRRRLLPPGSLHDLQHVLPQIEIGLHAELSDGVRYGSMRDFSQSSLLDLDPRYGLDYSKINL